MTKLPKTLFVTLEDAGTDDAYLNAQSDRNDLLGMNERKEVGEYTLKRRVEMRGVAEEICEVGG